MQYLSESEYQSPRKKWLKGRNSGEALYMHEIIDQQDIRNLTPALTENHFALLGYSCDVGVSLNKGRKGAKKGPRAFRKALATMCNHLPNHTKVTDFGNIVCSNNDLLANTQDNLASAIQQLLANNYKPVVIGGGHDIAFGHYMGIHRHFSASYETAKTGIINFDAHLDLRKAEPNSGTPFYQIAELVGPESFDYCAVGIRKESNHKKLYERANELGVTILPLEECGLQEIQKLKLKLNRFLEQIDRLYVTIDLDGFSAAYAPGVSAPHPIGLSVDVVLPLLNFILQSKKVVSVDFAELNPKYDIDNRTAQLAAYLAMKVMEYGAE